MLKKISIQIYSDFHIELLRQIPQIIPTAKYLFLVGNICQLNHPLFFKFFDYCSPLWDKIFYIPGNHEFYSKKNYNTLDFEYNLKFKEKYKNVFYVNNNFVELDENINVYGTTFWTISTFKRTCEAKKLINDYHNISYFDNTTNKEVNLDITYVNKMSNESFIKLQKYLIDNNKKTIVMTHFPPIRSGTSHPSYISENRIINLYFAWPDDTLSKFKLSNILCWISGHTHWSYDIIKENVRLISNQLGYKSEYGTTGINENGVYELSYDD